MEINVLLFATLKDAAGTARLPLALPGDQATVADVRRALAARFPGMAAQLEAAVAAVNEEFAFADNAVQPGDSVAFFPPVSGGDDARPEICRLATEPVNHDALIASVTIPETGAVCVFSGMVRGRTARSSAPAHTERLEYEAYEPMAIAKMQQVAAEIRERWPLVQGIAIVQRIGHMNVGENTIVIACSSGHRDEGCFEAARYGIDRLKEIVPVWKKEIGPSGAVWVEGHYVPTMTDRQD
jgi:molybdopterin synthase catalytic subunit